jgi:SnoaL-like domain
MSVDTQCIDAMLSAWNSHDETALGQIVEQSLSPDLEFCDPFHDIRGHAPFVEMVKAFWTQHGHCKITRTSNIDAHHDRARYSWLIEAPSGGRFEGFDAVALDLSTGKVRRVDGFFGQLSLA